MKSVLEKLKSRKLWAALAGLLAGLAIALGADESVLVKVSGAVTAAASVITYIAAEGRIDAAGVAGAAQAVQEALDAIASPGTDGEEKDN